MKTAERTVILHAVGVQVVLCVGFWAHLKRSRLPMESVQGDLEFEKQAPDQISAARLWRQVYGAVIR